MNATVVSDGVAETDDSLSIGRTVSLMAAAIRQHWLLFAVIGLGFGAPLALLETLFVNVPPEEWFTPANIGFSGSLWLVSTAMGAIAHGAMLRLILAEHDGDRASLGGAIEAGVRFMLPMTGLTIVVLLGASFGIVLLVVPGVIVFIMWSIAAAAMVSEDLGIGAALGRSRYLTRGSRWQMLALWTVVGVAMMGFQLGARPLLIAIEFDRWVMAAADVIVALPFSMLTTALTAVAYLELRRLKDGVNVDQLAEVFA